MDGEQLYDLISYNQLTEFLEGTFDTGPTEDGLHKFKSIQGPRGPYSPSDPEYLGSSDLLNEKFGRSLRDGKSQKTIHMLYNLMSNIVTTNGKMYKPRN